MLARDRRATLCVIRFWPHLLWSPIDWPSSLTTFPALSYPLTQPRRVQKVNTVTLHVCVPSHFIRVQLFETPWTIALQSPLSMGFSRQEYWSGLPCSPPRDLPDPGLPHCRRILYHLSHEGSQNNKYLIHNSCFPLSVKLFP